MKTSISKIKTMTEQENKIKHVTPYGKILIIDELPKYKILKVKIAEEKWAELWLEGLPFEKQTIWDDASGKSVETNEDAYNYSCKGYMLLQLLQESESNNFLIDALPSMYLQFEPDQPQHPVALSTKQEIMSNEQKAKTQTSMIICKSMNFSPSGMEYVKQLMTEWHNQESALLQSQIENLVKENKELREVLTQIAEYHDGLEDNMATAQIKRYSQSLVELAKQALNKP